MAKKQAAELPADEQRKPITPPAGVTPVKETIGNFWNPNRGDTIRGQIQGTKEYTQNAGKKDEKKVQRWQLIDAGGKLWTLPDHWDLDEKMKQLAAEHETPFPVFVGFEGFEPAPKLKSKKVARYLVGLDS